MFLRQAFSRHAPRLLRPAATSARVTATARRAMTTAGQSLQQLAAENPHVDVIRYEHKNVKFTLRHVDRSADSLAIGLLDCGLAPGDVVLSWLPSHFAEQHILQFACSKAGFTLFTLPASIATTDPDKAKEALAKALELSQASVLITQEAGNDTNYIRLVEEVIPEIRIFNMDDGMPFFTPRFPHLRLPIHTGFDYQDKGGMIPLMDMLCHTEDLEGVVQATGKIVDGKTGLMGEFEYGKDGVPTKVGKVLNNDEVVASGVWPEFSSILKREYREVEGVGVVF